VYKRLYMHLRWNKINKNIRNACMTACTFLKPKKNKQKKKRMYEQLYVCFEAWGASERMAGGCRWLKCVGWGCRWPKQAAGGLKHVSGGS
jgi:hypothetical protein